MNKVDKVQLIGLILTIAGLIGGFFYAKYSGWYFQKDQGFEAVVGFQEGTNKGDLTQVIVLKNIGELPLVNLSGRVSPFPPQTGEQAPYFKPVPWLEKRFSWSTNGDTLKFNWPIMNPGEDIEIGAIYHRDPIYSWHFQLKADSATFSDVINCNECDHKTIAKSLNNVRDKK